MAGQLIPRGENVWPVRVFLGRTRTATSRAALPVPLGHLVYLAV
jgi:hypothetical protein